MDYAIYINPKLDNYEEIFDDICNICFRIELVLKEILMYNPYIWFHWFKYDNSYKNYVLKYYYDKLKKEVNCTKDPNNELFYNHTIKNIIFDSASSKIDKNNETYITKNNQYIYKNTTKDKVIKCSLNTPLVNQLYVSFNDIIEFINEDHLYRTKFNLVRIKFNFNIVTQQRSSKEEFTKNVGGELLDVSISHKDDSGVEEFFDNIYNNISQITYVEPPSGFLFKNEQDSYQQYAYSLDYMFYDLEKIIFKLYYYPWGEPRKYRKRLYRLFYISIIDYFGGELKSNTKEIDNVNTRLININEYINDIYKIIFENDDSIINSLKFKKNNVKKSIKNISKLLAKKNDLFDTKKYINKSLINVLKLCIDTIEKTLFNYDLIDKKIVKLNYKPQKNIDEKIYSLDNLEKFCIYINDNLKTILETIDNTKDFCDTKTISKDLLKEFRFPGY